MEIDGSPRSGGSTPVLDEPTYHDDEEQGMEVDKRGSDSENEIGSPDRETKNIDEEADYVSDGGEVEREEVEQDIQECNFDSPLSPEIGSPPAGGWPPSPSYSDGPMSPQDPVSAAGSEGPASPAGNDQGPASPTGSDQGPASPSPPGSRADGPTSPPMSPTEGPASPEDRNEPASPTGSAPASPSQSMSGPASPAQSGSAPASPAQSGSGPTSPVSNRSASPASQTRSRSGSLVRSRSGSPARSQSGSPKRSQSGSPVRSRSGSPARSRSGSPARSRSGSPRSRSGSPARSRSGSPARSRSGSPKSRSGSPRSMSGSPARSRSGSPARSRSGSPARSRSGTPRSRSGSPARSRSGSPARSRSGSPRSRSGSPRSRSGSPRSRSASPARSRSPSPADSDVEDEKEKGRGHGSDEENDKDKDELIADIFGSSDEDEEFEGFGEADVEAANKKKEKKKATIMSDDEDEGVTGQDENQPIVPDLSDDENESAARQDGQDADFISDFDLMMMKKKEEMKKRRRKRGNVDIINDNDDLIADMIVKMKEAAEEDRELNLHKKPAITKLKMLQHVSSQLRKADLHSAFLDCGVLSAMTEWLAPLPDKSLPHLQIREKFLRILQEFPAISNEGLKASGVGKAIMYLYKHPKETKENKERAGKLINEWSRPIFNLTSNFSKEEREQRDYDQLPKRRRVSAEGMTPRRDIDKALTGEEKAVRPGDKGWVNRARVPMPSHKDYVVRPSWKMEDDEAPRKSSGKKEITRYEKHVRAFAEKKKYNKTQRAVGISIEGKNMAL